MEMTDSGMIKSTMRFEHDRKIDLQITVKFLLMIKDPLKPEQKSPTNKTESGISNEPENPEQLENIKKALPDVEVAFMPHSELKKSLAKTHAFIRTGEMTPYSNIILESGVTF